MFPIVNTYMNAAFKREHCRTRIRPVFKYKPISRLLSSVTQLHLIVFKCEYTYKKAAFRREENTAISMLFSSVNTNINYQGCYMYCQSRVYSKECHCRVTVNKNKQAHTICRSESNVALKFHQSELCYCKESYRLNASYHWEQDRNVLKSFFTTLKKRHITNFICYQNNL